MQPEYSTARLVGWLAGAHSSWRAALQHLDSRLS